MIKKLQKLHFYPAIGWSILIFILCFLPGSSLPKETWLDKIYFDKIVHIGLYFIFYFLLYIANQKKNSFAFPAILCLSQGILIEYIQGSSFIVGRSFDVWDIVANCIGIFLSYLMILRIKL